MSVFDLTEEQQMLADSMSRLHRDAGYPDARATGTSGDAWRALAGLGIASATLPEQMGGMALTLSDVLPSMSSAGQHATKEPLFSAFLAGLACGQVAEGAALEIDANQLENGEATLATLVAFADTLHVTRADDSFVMNGTLPVVIDSGIATELLVVARVGDEERLCRISFDDAGVTATRFKLLDGRDAAKLVLSDVICRDAQTAVLKNGSCARLQDMAAVLLCADAAGALEAIRDLTRDYLPDRQQFGVPLSSHQVLQHALVDIYHELEHVNSLLHLAARSCDGTDDGVRAKSVSALKRFMGTRIRTAASSAVQLHGGIGYTEEYLVGHYLKRILVAEMLFGTASAHASRFAAILREEIRAEMPDVVPA